jgi:hypothetical protein
MSAARKVKSLEDHLAGLKFKELKKLCKANDLDLGGNKKVLWL